MKQSLDLRLSQHLTITPQLQQAIRLLQLSSLELRQEVQQALETNPLLEEREDEDAREGEEPASEDADEEAATWEATESTEDAEGMSATDTSMAQSSLSEEQSIDSDWTESFDYLTAPTGTSSGAGGDDDGPDIEARSTVQTSLADHLAWQLQLISFSETDRHIAEAIIDAISEDGYLTVSLDDLRQTLLPLATEPEEIEAVLHQIQNFDPVGVGARDAAECMHLQMNLLPLTTPGLPMARRLATPEHLAALAARDFPKLKRLLGASEDELRQAITLIQQLNPRPGSAVSSTRADYIVPDVIVRKIRAQWRVELNPEVAPRLRVNRQYSRMVRRGDGSSGNLYLKDHLQQARWLIKSLESRYDTLLRVSKAIVERQYAFFDHGPEAMKPLVLSDIAQVVGMHESTISRVTNSKYMTTPRGVFELKYFFSSGVATDDGGAASATAIRSLIAKIVRDETPSDPASDAEIAKQLVAQGIRVARRTVAKYRELMDIPPSHRRKSIL